MSAWKEELPPDCPPDVAQVPSGESYYRLITGESPTEEDFYSVLKINPAGGGDPCYCRAVSIFIDLEACRRASKMPTLRNRMNRIALVTPTSESGVIMQTRGPEHFSWWIAAACNPLVCCGATLAI